MSVKKYEAATEKNLAACLEVLKEHADDFGYEIQMRGSGITEVILRFGDCEVKFVENSTYSNLNVQTNEIPWKNRTKIIFEEWVLEIIKNLQYTPAVYFVGHEAHAMAEKYASETIERFKNAGIKTEPYSTGFNLKDEKYRQIGNEEETK